MLNHSFSDWLRTRFSRYNCLVFTAFGNKQFSNMVSKLDRQGIPYRSRFHNTGSDYFNDSTQYDIYVKKQDERKAQQAIHTEFKG
ncbi:hypothetical protein EIZ39_25190 [Ammoniphilus sp. CFH 90114]|nr:hypothetical protein EIZ39_25190 [Ammoniphilus sp. CFH 90114]